MADEQREHLTASRKADFSSTYNQPDPRAYFAAISPLDYQIPQQALPIFNRVLHVSAVEGVPRKVLDVCCGYGINAALLRYDLELDTLTRQYAQSDLPHDQQLAVDKEFFAERALRLDLDVLGLDVAHNAIRYATETDLLTAGWAENIEVDKPSPQLREALRDVGLVICTGGIGYISAATFASIAAALDDPADLWMVAFVLRVFSFDDVAAVLEGYGLVTEKLPGGSFRQRRFTSTDEQSAAISDVKARGLDPSGHESDGWFYADCYLTRPAAAVSRLSARDLSALLSRDSSESVSC